MSPHPQEECPGPSHMAGPSLDGKKVDANKGAGVGRGFLARRGEAPADDGPGGGDKGRGREVTIRGSGQASGPHHRRCSAGHELFHQDERCYFPSKQREGDRIISSPALVYNDIGNLKHEIEKTKTTITNIITCLLPFLLSSRVSRSQPLLV